jgi:hypothetical protein
MIRRRSGSRGLACRGCSGGPDVELDGDLPSKVDDGVSFRSI